jgi:hypothetical protein
VFDATGFLVTAMSGFFNFPSGNVFDAKKTLRVARGGGNL